MPGIIIEMGPYIGPWWYLSASTLIGYWTLYKAGKL